MIPRLTLQKRQAALTALLQRVNMTAVPAWAYLFKMMFIYTIEKEQYEIGLLLENGFLFSGFTQEATNENLGSSAN